MNYFGAMTTKVAIAPQSVTNAATTTGIELNLQGVEGDILFTGLYGSLSGSDATFTWKLTECATSGGSFTDVATGGTFPTVGTFASDNVTVNLVVPREGLLQYVKVVCTSTGTTTALIGAAATYRLKTTT
jgi:hypothetical protein